MLYPKPLSYKYALGGVAVLASLAATHELQRRKGGDVKHAPPKPEEQALNTSDVEAVPLTKEVELASVKDAPRA